MHDVVCEMGLVLFFFKRQIGSGDYSYEGLGSNSGADLKIDEHSLCSFGYMNPDVAPDGAMLEYQAPKGKDVRIVASSRDIAPDNASERWRSNGRIISVYDLLNSSLVIQLTSTGSMRSPLLSSETSVIDDSRKKMKLHRLILKIPNGILLAFDEDNLEEHVDKSGYRFYIFSFPDSLEKILARARFDEFKELRDFGP